jgi:hypothetical protein
MQPQPGASFCQAKRMPPGQGTRISLMDSLGKEQTMLGTLLIVLLILVLLGALPRWSHSRNWGYVPTGGVGLALLIVVVLVLLGRL